MARPRAKELTERELEVMHAFWQAGGATVAEIQSKLEEAGRPLAYTTVATLIKILNEKDFLVQVNENRPFIFEPSKSFEEVSGNLLTDVVQRVFQGSREQLLVRLFGQQHLSKKEKAMLKKVLEEQDQ